MIMSVKDKVLNTITSHPRLVTLGIGLTVTFVVGTAIGMVDHGQIAYATSHSGSGFIDPN